MFLFLKLYLAHFISDFVLQFEELYELKVRNMLGHILHVLIHILISIILVFPYLGNLSIWIFIIVISSVHLAQDLLKYHLAKKNKKNVFLYFVIDQFLHFAFLTTIFLLPLSTKILGFPNNPVLNFIYINNQWTLYAMFFIALTFAGSYFLNAFHKSYLKNTRPLHFITSFEIAYSLFERGLMGAIILFASPKWILILPLLGVFRIPFKILKNRNDFFMSFIYSVFLSLIFRLYIL